MSVNKYDKINNRLLPFAGNGGGGGSAGIRYDEETDMVQLFYNGEWVDWKSGVAYPIGTFTEFQITLQVEEFTIPADGIYKLEVYGAAGGTPNGTYVGGKGGYAVGNKEFNKGDKIYICVGEQGKTQVNVAGRTTKSYNGGGYAASGGNGQSAGAGGGATHIALQKYDDGTLTKYDTHREALLIVAGGGGGGYYDTTAGGRNGIGGTGGGTNGGSNNGGTSRSGGTQSTGYAFGEGQSEYTYGAGAGGGWYGGYAGGLSPAAGGSGYVNTSELISGSTNMENGVRSGNGYAKITYLGRG